MAGTESQNGGARTEEARLLELELAKAQAEAKAAEALAKAKALEAALAQKQAAAAEPEKPATEPTDEPNTAAAGTSEPAALGAKTVQKPVKEKPRRAAAAGTAAGAAAAAAGAATAAAERPASAAKAKPRAADEEDELQPAGGSFIGNWLRASSSWMLSMVVHLLALIILALFYIPVPDRGDTLPLMASVESDELEELEELELDQFEMDEMEALAFDVQDPGMAELGDTVELEASDVEIATMSVSDTMDTIGTLFGEHGKGWASADAGSGGAEFYGAKTRGKRFVFIIDNSLSMNKGRFESALYELMYTVGKMASDQEFYVYFFSDTAYPLFYPRPAEGMVKATKENKQRLYQWLGTVQLVLRTDAKPAVQQALAMQPHGVYILTDGAFTDDTARFLLNKEGVEKFIKEKTNRYYRPPTIHTVDQQGGGREGPQRDRHRLQRLVPPGSDEPADGPGRQAESPPAVQQARPPLGHRPGQTPAPGGKTPRRTEKGQKEVAPAYVRSDRIHAVDVVTALRDAESCDCPVQKH